MTSARSEHCASFKVMDVLARAGELERQGRSIMHLEVGQPQTGAPIGVRESATAALSDRLGYTHTLGILPLRQRICRHYKEKYGVDAPEKGIVVTTGSSGAFLLGFIAAFDAGDRVAVASASYPCYRNILTALGCEVVTIEINEEYKVTASSLRRTMDNDAAAGRKKLKGIILSSPSNPTGAMLTEEELKGLAETCDEKGIIFFSDEIYHGICFEGRKDCTALAFSKNCVVINSFSKYYSMTGWRLGWMVVPEFMIDAVNRLSQNMYISAPTLSQMAGVAAFDCTEELEGHIKKYAENRKIILEALAEMGFHKVAPANGAFYIYVDVSEHVHDSVHMCSNLLEVGGVATTPGVDFEDPSSGVGNQRFRLSYCGATADTQEAMQRMKNWWKDYDGKQLKN